MVRTTVQDDTEALLAIIAGSGEFDEASVDHVRKHLNSYLDGQDDSLWYTADDGEPVGVAYCAREPVTDGTWNLLMLWTRPDRSNRGHGQELVREVERAVAWRGGRLLIVETSGLPAYSAARSFYAKCGFAEEARIRDFFAAGDDKIVFTKALTTASDAA